MALALAAEAAEPKTGKRWIDMDYGPFLSASIGAPQPKTNIAYKGIAINLGAAFGGARNEAVVFDTDLMRYSAGWTGDFVALKGVVFDGEHWAYPAISGQQVFGNPPKPGWAKAGRFDDPREYPFGPLPRDWAHWKGLYLHGNRVVLSYTVGNSSVLELPSLERAGETTAFVRTFNLGPSDTSHIMQIAFEAGRRTTVVRLENLALATASLPASQSLALLSPPRESSATNAADNLILDQGVLGRWEFDEGNGDTAADQSENRRVITLRGAQWTSSGHEGKALTFAGQQHAEMARPDDINFTDSDLTLAAWVRTAQDGTIIAKTAPGAKWVPDGMSLFVRNGRLTFDVGWVGAVQSTRKVNDGHWHHVALGWSHREGRAMLFVDGSEDGSAILKPRQSVRGHVVRIGFTAPNFPASPWFRGSIDGLRIYNRMLRPEEIAVLAGGKAQSDIVAAGFVGELREAVWIASKEGHLRLQLPPSGRGAHFKVLIWRGPRESLPAFAQLVKSAPRPVNLEPLTHGGPARWKETLTTQGKLGTHDGPYAIDTLTAPEENPWDSWMRFGGVDFLDQGRRAVLSTWNGDVWIASGIDGSLEKLSWKRIATGLFQPLGLKVVDNRIYVLGRDQITLLHDLNGDGEADFYQNFNNDCMVSEHFHEFATDLKLGPDGNFYYIKCACHGREAMHPHNGTLMKVSRDGAKLEVVARGFRAVNGLGVGPHGELTAIDNQGHWMPGNRIDWIKPGGWHGYQWAWNPEHRTNYDEPLCWMHNFVDRSGGTQLWVPTDQWGPLKDELITISYGMGHMFLVLKEDMGGQMQGGVTRFPLEFETGVMRGAFHPKNHQLYTCGLYGWAGNKTKAGEFYRVRYTGKPLHLPNRLNVASDGIVLGFTDPLDETSGTDPGDYDVKCWNYHWTAQYGSPDFKLNGEEGRDTLPVESATLSADRKAVFLKVPRIQPVMQMHIVVNLKAADGLPIQNFVHHTIHRLGPKPGLEMLGPGALARRQETQTSLANEAPGLIQTMNSKASPLQKDVREVRLAALYVPTESSPTPFVNAGPFRAAWQGFLKLDLNDEMMFHTEGRGAFQLRINERPVLAAPSGNLDGLSSQIAPLRRGLNRFELTYDSPPVGDAVLRLSWSSKRTRLEPIPPMAFVHDASNTELQQAQLIREGRLFFATRYCLKCHQDQSAGTHREPHSLTPSLSPTGGEGARRAGEGDSKRFTVANRDSKLVEVPHAMPELDADAPSLDGLGGRLNAAWLAQWIADPRSMRADALMPRSLAGSPAEVFADARDIAAYLSSLRTPVALSNASTQTPATPPDLTDLNRQAAGEKLFADLGCVACHSFSDDASVAQDPRLPLGYAKAKWQVPALVEFLRKPNKDFRWIRMPDFQLSVDEATALAAFLWKRSDRVSPASPERNAGILDRGRQLVTTLGCLGCHNLEGVTNAATAPTLAELLRSDGKRGCLAEEAANRGKAPDFGFTNTQRQAVMQFVRADRLPALERDVPAEFSSRQYAALRCNACHPRDTETDFWSSLKLAPVATGAVKAAANSFDEDESPSAGSVHIGRPPLTFAGEKLYAQWTEQFLLGALPYKPRSKLQGRMPAFPAYARGLAEGMAQQHGYSSATPPLPMLDPGLAEMGKRLTGVNDGFSCVSCHDVGEQKALAGKDTATINFAYIADRLRPSYYRRYIRDPQHLLPGTMMPNFIGDDGTTPFKTILDGDPERQFTAIWHYLMSLRRSSAK